MGYNIITGQMPDISEYCDFASYYLVRYWLSAHTSLGGHVRELAQWVGVGHKVGSNMCYWLVPISGVPIANMMVQHVMTKDMCNPDLQPLIEEFIAKLKQFLDDVTFVLQSDINYDYPWDVYKTPKYGDTHNGDPGDEYQEAGNIESYDNLVGATYLLTH